MKTRAFLLIAGFFLSGLYANDFCIGPCCPLSGSCTNVFSSLSHTILPGDAASMEKINVQSKEIDLTLMPLTGAISFNKSGFYKITWNAEAHAASTDFSTWSMGLTIDNIIVPGSVYGDSSATLTSQKVGGTVVLCIVAGQLLRLVNTSSSAPVTLVANSCQHPLASVSLSLSWLDP